MCHLLRNLFNKDLVMCDVVNITVNNHKRFGEMCFLSLFY